MQLASQVNSSSLSNFWMFLLERLQDKIIKYRIVYKHCVVRCYKWKESATQKIVRSWILLKNICRLFSQCVYVYGCVLVWVCERLVFVFMDLYYISFSRQSIACLFWVIPFKLCVSTRTSECNMINDVKRPVNAVSCDLYCTLYCCQRNHIVQSDKKQS